MTNGFEGDAPAPPLGETRIAAGVAVIEGYLKTLPSRPGVYRMIKETGDVLYVGKAKNLKKRVTSYTNLARQPNRLKRMISQTASMEFVTTHTEAEALLLEANLIKRFQPRYNILLRDDKSFASILVTGDHAFPRVLKHRGGRSRTGDYFGPFASAWAVNETLAVLQRAFLLRSCTDAVFSARTRPCLLYQIKRCSAPCVDRTSQDDYAKLVDQARAFLSGESHRIQQQLAENMQAASDRLEFEMAAQYRDRISALTRVQAHQDINLSSLGTADVVAVHQAGGQSCIQVFFFRAGRNYGNRAYFPSHARDDDAPQVLEAFLGQFYASHPPPRSILLSHRLTNAGLIGEALSVRADRPVRISVPQRGEKRKLVLHASANARDALSRRLAESATQRRLLEGLATHLELNDVPIRIEVYDNSHISGTKEVGGMIVAGPEGLIKAAYRKFNIRRQEGSAPGDDYAMMREVLTRRFARAQKEDPERRSGQWPDLVLIDGGQGQLGIGLEVFAELGIEDVTIAAISKGPERNAGREKIHLPGRDPVVLEARDPVLYFLQRLRDEAHRFAIGAHRTKRSGGITKSVLDEIPGIGAKRKKALLHHFGSAGAVSAAGHADLEAVDGISKEIANKIYQWFHADG
ncbi:MAG: excinuclease ABC subunit UvrC [Rhodospirillales bacterium]|jgi:excinuclease ABC subunit C|nr:excinuclease ABC subunit UvrC [Rhodospirillales bacterium]